MARSAGARRAAKRFFQRYWRILFFIFYWGSSIYVSFYTRIDGKMREDDIADSYESWVGCEFVTGDDDEDSECSFDEKPTKLVVLSNFYLNTSGLVIFFLFGVRKVHLPHQQCTIISWMGSNTGTSTKSRIERNKTEGGGQAQVCGKAAGKNDQKLLTHLELN